MPRRAAPLVPLVSLGATSAVLLALLAPAAVSAAPAPTPPDGAAPRVSGPDTPRGDRDGDHISDELAPALRAAERATRFDVIVRGLTAREAESAVGAFRVTHRLPLIDGFSAVMTAGQARALARHPRVLRVDRDGVAQVLDDAANADYGATAARADRAGLDGDGVGLCVIDTGVDPLHEQIAPRSVVFADFVGTRTAPYDDHGHGTHVMNIAAGDGVGGSTAATFQGVAPAASLYAAKVLDASGFGSDSQVIKGIEWCHAQTGVQVISMSLGDTIVSDGSDPVSAAVDVAEAGGDVVVVAGGNSGDKPSSINAPGVARGALTVGAASDWSAPTGTARHDDGIWLAAFSSRGPVGSRTKPDVVAPGVTITAAKAGTTNGYVTLSGTSMATPYVAGAVALALEADPAATPGEIRSAMTATAVDRGTTGADNEWGWGLVDVRAFVESVAGSTTPLTTAFPTWERQTGTVPSNGSVELPVVVPADGLGVPLALTLTVTSGQLVCDLYCQIGFTAGEWSPDLDAELINPAGQVVAVSECALAGVSCTTGRQETLAIRPSAAGTYRLRVYAWTGGSGAGGSFRLDVSRGPLTTTTVPENPPPPANAAPVADAGPDVTVVASGGSRNAKGSFTLDGTGSADDGTIVGYTWKLGRKVAGTSATLQQTKSVGTYSYELVVTDDGGLTDSDLVTITVTR